MLGSSIDTGLISYRLDALFSALALAHRLHLHKLSRGQLAEDRFEWWMGPTHRGEDLRSLGSRAQRLRVRLVRN
jgi:hypothetical protein